MMKRFEWVLNEGAIVAFALGLVCCALPNRTYAELITQKSCGYQAA